MVDGVKKMAIIWLLMAVFIGTMVCAPTSYAYVDPGTGSAIFGGLAYLLALGSAALALLLRPVRSFLKLIFFKSGKPTDKDQQ